MSSQVKVVRQKYGKSHVRLMKVKRDTKRHEVKELLVCVLLEGDFETSYTEGDNSLVIPTDTQKNTVYALAKKHHVDDIESFALYISKHFLSSDYPQVKGVHVEIDESIWERVVVDSKEHNHAFVKPGKYTRYCKLFATHSSAKLTSGFKDLRIMKTTKSGFEDYFRDKYTTLQPTRERIMHTCMSAEWTYVGKGQFKIVRSQGSKSRYNEIFDTVLDLMIKQFAGDPVNGTYSGSVQNTLYEMARNCIKEINELDEVSVVIPNVHCFLFDLEKLGMKNNDEIFHVTTEPYGYITATIKRDGSTRLYSRM